ncbi:oligopeptide transport ATP-binding protein AppD [Devosia pacifica]|uniref:Nickel import system ATP-binding protein NikD n=1 Tax=Devosia pacifica TaxID=1335967 RepID=A0A918VSC7_9HYPH|nr:ABC transporter ATP-binding protein [Devosia pacifica]GHA24958.1 oligopeptide transport ATP-binding protein AppD [Devosia pacifica]
MTESLLTITDLSIDSLRDGTRRRIVEGFNLSVRAGEIYGLVGESGSGKSISMMASVGLAAQGLDVRSGTVNFGTRRFAASDQKSLRGNLSHGVSLLFQNAKGALNPFITVGKQVERVLRRRRRSDIQGELKELFRVVGLNYADLGRKYPHQVSGGQAQRVAMACALATEPALLIADEPTTALDVTTEREMLRFLASICRQRNMAVVLIAHNLSLVSEYCSSLSILHAGQVVETGNLAPIFAEPLHPYTQGLIAAVPDVDSPRELVPLIGSVWGGSSELDRCRFSHRCPHAMPRCERRIPPAVKRDGREVHCVLYEQEVSA